MTLKKSSNKSSLGVPVKPFCLKTKELVRGLGDLVVSIHGELPPDIKGIAIDSRQVRQGYLFVAIRGERSSGEEYIEHAVRNGANMVILPEGAGIPKYISSILSRDTKACAGIAASLFYGNPTESCPVVAVTGTNGKTTFTYLMEAILKEAGLRPGVIGTVNYRLGSLSWPAPLTTPDPVTLQRTIREMITNGADSIIMEASSHALDQKRLWGSKIRCAVFTNMTRDHLDYHKTMDNYFLAKQSLFSDYCPEVSVFNIDDPYGKTMYLHSRGESITYAIDNEADIRPKKLNIDINGIYMAIDLYGKTVSITSELIGKFNVYNILAAVSAAISMEIPSHAIQMGIAKCRNIPGRMERVASDSSIMAFVDYAHTPDAVERILKEISLLGPRRVITVLGCGGDRDRGKRPLMGAIASRLSDIAVFTTDNPRSEDPLRIIDDMLHGVSDRDRMRESIKVIPDREEAIFWAIEQAKTGDAVLVLGKGHETCQIIDNQKIYFDDRVILKRALEEKLSC
ncbi:UDP-N-acetylmuramoylalanyl-D-glutamate--2, 6-diaminopimelate ligase [Dissulfuribacter thermophilus]|uniref:UDP-N-acetylmuramoyl-L-alanyl-D-glutamate--2,6-diaminopimelate ligase n=1 Tax=Dissulfuribacter thermophilus TaxID=1156395 RepID=A0A1B9F488_9BACT|nr:UDP-N-acetylmuramoyl-L-alanyl-D-glutamate--2,6-diaminopimelate ligase [Dissulfuribacter thermophilus]OCC14748.1 UDP-N-acetylmuramoylalanyl-D-glutamate--2, 6-diaminopimelate ligase [Dissulfuribacter thermophilus]